MQHRGSCRASLSYMQDSAVTSPRTNSNQPRMTWNVALCECAARLNVAYYECAAKVRNETVSYILKLVTPFSPWRSVFLRYCKAGLEFGFTFPNFYFQTYCAQKWWRISGRRWRCILPWNLFFKNLSWRMISAALTISGASRMNINKTKQRGQRASWNVRYGSGIRVYYAICITETQHQRLLQNDGVLTTAVRVVYCHQFRSSRSYGGE